MKTLKITIVGVLGLLGLVCFMNELDERTLTDLAGIVLVASAVLLYRKWNVNGELDEDEYI